LPRELALGAPVLLVLGAASVIYGATLAIGRSSSSEALAYSSISQVGYLLIVLSLGGVIGYSAAVLYAVTNALNKTLLFLAAPLRGWLVGAALALTVALLISSNTAVAPPEAATEPGATRRWLLLALLVLAATLRLPFLGSAEFQGRRRPALSAGDGHPARAGRPAAAASERPARSAVARPAAGRHGAGQRVDGRLPFALAGIGTVLGAYLLAERLFPRRSIGWQAGLVAALTLALDGFLIAFSRIVQYQSIVLLMSTGAVLCAWQAAQGAPHPRRWLTVSAALAAVALLAHYDGIYVLPVLVWLALWTAWQQGRQPAVWLRLLWLPALMGAGLLASFYIPFFTHEQFGGTIGYLSDRWGRKARQVAGCSTIYRPTTNAPPFTAPPTRCTG
ncbi:MAG: phospholipid carrier-dependent glycosyltransferase, partial [Chloroflexaceae bacterium]|nr:phospholipid carrier-dependent glycosyltransferase [Chloroflexaceae bacterium]